MRSILALLAVVAAFAAAAADSGRRIVVVTDDNYPPHLFRGEDGQLQGHVKDKWELWSRYSGIAVELRGMRWAEAQEAVRKGDADVLDVLAYTPERAKAFELSHARGTIEARLFFHRTLSAVNDPRSLRGLLVGAKQASACADWLRARGVPDIRTYPDSPTLVAAAADGDVRVYCMDSPVAMYLMYRQGISQAFPESTPMYSAPLHWAVQAGRADLRDAVQASFDAIPAQELEAIDTKWLGSPPPARFDLRTALALGIVPLGLLALTAGLGVWNRCLRLKLRKRVEHFATQDTLTGLPGRALLHDRLSQALADSARRNNVVAVLFVDLDRFKAVNDTYGHDRGDRVLKEASRRLLGCVRESDSVGRNSSDEFVIVLADIARADDAGVIARKVLAELHRPFDLGGEPVYCTASIGIAIHPGDGSSAATLIRNADIAMYRAKEHGRNNFQYFLPEMHQNAVRRLQLDTGLRGALERGEFELHYQPRVSLAHSRVMGFEALLRWRHPQLGLLLPAEFIAVLEDSDLIVTVGEWALREACAQVARWRRDGHGALPIAVNLSARQFRMAGLDALVAAIVSESGIDPALLELELTESVLMHDPEETAKTLANLKRYGVRLAVDDFGTGYSSLMYLKRFPIDALKIDRAFISDVTSNPEDAAIALAIINLGHSLGLKAVAEGVETEAQREFLRAHGCDEMQGFLFSRAVSAADATRLLPLAKAA